jgi:hypothetical protein
MDIISYLDVPLHLLIGTVIGFTALVVLLRGFTLPPDFPSKEQARSELRRKVMELEKLSVTDEKSGDD